jgi:hypothetical protein
MAALVLVDALIAQRARVGVRDLLNPIESKVVEKERDQQKEVVNGL